MTTLAESPRTRRVRRENAYRCTSRGSGGRSDALSACSRGVSFESLGVVDLGEGAGRGAAVGEPNIEACGGASFELSGVAGFGAGAAIVEILNGEVLGGVVQQGEKI